MEKVKIEWRESGTVEKLLEDHSSLKRDHDELKQEHEYLQIAFNNLLRVLNQKLSKMDAQIHRLENTEPAATRIFSRPLGEIETREYFYNV